MLKLVLPPDVIANAMVTAENRPKFVVKHRPSSDPDADIVGALPEHAWAWLYKFPQDIIRYDQWYGDGGVDFTMKQGTVDIKASQRHKDSWTVKMGDLRSEWYVFSYVVLPDTVFFIAKAHRDVLKDIKETIVRGVRIVRLKETPGVTEFWKKDFSVVED